MAHPAGGDPGGRTRRDHQLIGERRRRPLVELGTRYVFPKNAATSGSRDPDVKGRAHAVDDMGSTRHRRPLAPRGCARNPR
jgi:hypothetical protein